MSNLRGKIQEVRNRLEVNIKHLRANKRDVNDRRRRWDEITSNCYERVKEDLDRALEETDAK